MPDRVLIPSEPTRPRRRPRPGFLPLLLLVLLLLLAALDACWIEPHLLLTITRYDLLVDQLPQSWAGRTLAFFTDTHLGPAYPPERLARLARVIDEAGVDLILFGGDLIDSRTPSGPDYDQRISQALAQFQAPWGQYAVVGNHDNRLQAEHDRVARLLETGGFTLLENTSVILDGLWLGGLAESYFSSPDLDRCFSSQGLVQGDLATEPACRLLLMHQPDHAADLPAHAGQLRLSGHSHNGQVTFFGRPILTVYEGRHHPYGLYRLQDGNQLLVSRGLGTVGLPVRFFAPPELVLITLNPS